MSKLSEAAFLVTSKLSEEKLSFILGVISNLSCLLLHNGRSGGLLRSSKGCRLLFRFSFGCRLCRSGGGLRAGCQRRGGRPAVSELVARRGAACGTRHAGSAPPSYAGRGLASRRVSSRAAGTTRATRATGAAGAAGSAGRRGACCIVVDPVRRLV